MPAHRVNKVGRVCSTPGCCRLAMLDRPQCTRCKQVRAMPGRRLRESDEDFLEQRRLSRKLQTTRA